MMYAALAHLSDLANPCFQSSHIARIGVTWDHVKFLPAIAGGATKGNLRVLLPKVLFSSITQLLKALLVLEAHWLSLPCCAAAFVNTLPRR